ncbi:30S ribosomal protein S11 [Candidatus Saccharibacteria bacterium CG10_big_fil_rev_8_21_14_0_10_47_8]|nr:MAG: 30S ribosomal protein S11 [Candidatus Saccharibacteria bacterium CG10_big_fil_rev_8_21_14_0_10_47_8]
MAEETKVLSQEISPETEIPVKAAPKKKKSRRAVTQGLVHVLATFNNTIITVTDTSGNVLTTASAGSAGFRGSKKGTAYAAQVAAEKAISTAKQNYGLEKVDVSVRGVGMGREAAIRTLINQKVQVDSIKDITGIAHGGTRPRKAKRN